VKERERERGETEKSEREPIYIHIMRYGWAMISRLLKNVGLFCRI